MQAFEGTLSVQVQQTAVVDPVLTVGALAASVVVEDVTPLVTTDAPVERHVLERERIEQLPISDSNVITLVQTLPGTIGPHGRAYGLRAGIAETSVDGASTVDRTLGSYRPDVGMESVQEFSLETNNSSARFARPTTMVVSTKSGTNQLHGSLYERHRNSAVGKARRREDVYEKAPQLIQNEWGASSGGPVLLPRVYDGRNRTFWFFSYEGYRRVNPQTRGYRVPTEAMRQGDFSGLVDAQGRSYLLYDPFSTDTRTWARQPFAHGGKLNAIGPSRMSPVAKYLFSLTPLPSHPHINPLVDNNLWLQAPIWRRSYWVSSRVDHQISTSDRLFVRYSRSIKHQRLVQNPQLSLALRRPDELGELLNRNWSQSAAVSYTRIFSPSLFNELVISGARSPFERAEGPLDDFAGELGLPNPFGSRLFPKFNELGLINYEFNSGNRRYQHQGNLQIADHVTKMMGRHELQFGGSFRYQQINNLPDSVGMAGTLSFNTLATALYDPKSSANNPLATARTGHNLANLYLGVANYAITFRRPNYYLRDREYALYLQDNFRAGPRLTVNLGLRWEYWTEYREKHRNMVSFDPALRAVVLAQPVESMYLAGYTLPSIVERYRSLGANFTTFDQAGLPETLMDPNGKNFGPRIGVAWRPWGGRRAAVLRGGFRISYTSLPLNTWIGNNANNPPMLANFRNSLNDAAQSPDGRASYGMRSVPAVIAGVNSRDAIDLSDASLLTRGSANIIYMNRNQLSTYVQDWNLKFEKEIRDGIVARVGYIGNHGGRFPQYYQYNEAPPDYVWFMTTGLPKPTGEYANVARRPYDQQVYGNIREFRRTGWSNYNGLQFDLKRRFSRGVGFQLTYTVGNALATGSQDAPAAASAIPELNQFMPGIVPADLDERNRFLNYQRDISFPKHQVRWNWLVDLPFGSGKPILRRANGLLEKIVGGWQVAGLGSLVSNYFTLPTSIFPTGEKIEIYGYKYPIQDCRSGACRPGYLWWNGYIPAHLINSVDAQGRPSGIMGVPANYKPAGQPLLPWPANPDPNDPMYGFYGGNTVWVPLNNGASQRTTYSPGIHPWQNQYFPGVRQWKLDASLFKRFALGERAFLRFNVEFFNVLNHPGNPNSIGSEGILSTRNSGTDARQIQFMLRLSW